MHIRYYLVGLLLGLVLTANAKTPPKQRQYQTPNMAQFIALEQGFTALLTDNDSQPLHHYYHSNEQREEQPFTRLVSKTTFGWGELWFNNKPGRLFVQVPHRYHDRLTYNIAKHWWHSGQVSWLMFNNVHRYAGQQADNNKQRPNSDWSTAQHSPLSAASRSFVKQRQDPLVIQLHGFAKNKRQTPVAQQADVILSHGSNLPGAYLLHLNRIASCIKRQLPVRTAIYPQDLRELGGTTNQVGKQLRKAGLLQAFIHVELSAQLRQTLAEDQQKSMILLNCIGGEQA